MDFEAMMNYFFVGLAGLGLIAVILLATCSCTKKDPAASSVASNAPAEPPHKTDSDKGVFVIGREIAKAAEAEKRRQQQGPRESPLPKQGYDFWHGDQLLIDPAPSPLDDALREVVRKYAASTPQQRAVIRDSISMDGFYTLMTFAQRSAVFAIRERNVEIARDGLTAVAMIDQERVDFRDIPAGLYLLYHAANRIGADADRIFRQIGKLSDTEVGEQIGQFVEHSKEWCSLRSSLFVEVQTEKGVGFIDRDVRRYNPTLNLESLVIAVARLVATDKYQPQTVSVETELPPIWLSRGKNADLDRVLSRVRGGATIHARLRPNEHPEHAKQGFYVFIVETSQPDDAQILLRLSQAKDVQGHCMIGGAAGRLFALIVAQSEWIGVGAYETTKTLARFEKGLTNVLGAYAEKRR